MNINRIPVAFYGKRRIVAPEISYKYNQKQVLEIQGFYGLPEYFRVDFANEGDTLAKSVIGTPDGIEIPDEYLLTGKAIKVYIVLNGPDESVQTVAEIDIPVRGRLPVSEETPTPQEQSIIDSLIAALNEGVDRAETAADEAEQHEADASADALKAEGYATGTQNGEAVEEGSDYYHNNAAYFAGQASEKAAEAAGSATAAAGSASAASGSAGQAANSATAAGRSASAAAGSASEAAGSATTAGQKATAASQSASQAEGSATAAAGSASSASGSATTASQKAGEASQKAGEAAAASRAIQNMGVESETLEEGSEASVEKTVDPETGAVTLSFGIPKGYKGDKGDKGDAATTVTNIMDMDTGKKYTVAQTVVNGYLVETFTEVQE